MIPSGFHGHFFDVFETISTRISSNDYVKQIGGMCCIELFINDAMPLDSLVYRMVDAGNIPDGTESVGHEAFIRLIESEKKTIDKVCFFYSSSQSEFDAMRQDVLINIWRGLPGFRGECRKSTWVYRICLNTCVVSFRIKDRSRGMLPLDMAGDVASEDAENEHVEQLYNLIDTLAPTEKALILMWLDGFTYEEIAETAGCGRNTVATRLRRIKELLINKAQKL